MDPTLHEPRTSADPDAQRSEPDPEQADEAPVEEELLVEEISIDGMCGVY